MSSDPTEGRKFDGEKPQWYLVPWRALTTVVEVLTFGAQKYAPDNWKYVEGARHRYFDATQRHLVAWQEGEMTDPETGKNHLAHAICCLLFLLWFDQEPSDNLAPGGELKK